MAEPAAKPLQGTDCLAPIIFRQTPKSQPRRPTFVFPLLLFSVLHFPFPRHQEGQSTSVYHRATSNMADHRPEDLEMPRMKRPKTNFTDDVNDRNEDTNGKAQSKKKSQQDLDPKTNPYLAHQYEENSYENGYSNNYGNGYGNENAGFNFATSSLAKFQRHKTTATQAHAAEDGPLNPFNGDKLSDRYFGILKTRRDLPVHKQR